MSTGIFKLFSAAGLRIIPNKDWLGAGRGIFGVGHSCPMPFNCARIAPKAFLFFGCGHIAERNKSILWAIRERLFGTLPFRVCAMAGFSCGLGVMARKLWQDGVEGKLGKAWRIVESCPSQIKMLGARGRIIPANAQQEATCALCSTL